MASTRRPAVPDASPRVSWPDLVCPCCREPAAPEPVAAPLAETEDGALLTCVHPGCGAVYPVLDGVPVVLRDRAGWLRHQGALAAAPLVGDAAWEAALAWLPPEDPLRQGREALAAAVAAGLAGWLPEGAAPPPPDGPDAAPTAGPALERWLDTALPPGAAAAVDLGCGVGAAALALAARGLTVVALDLLLAPLRLLRRLRDAGAADVPLRTAGSRYTAVRCRRPVPLHGRLTVLAADALDPPLRPESFDVVHAGAVLDNVPSPLRLLGQADALLRVGGRLLLTHPAAYDATITPEAEWLGVSGRGGPSAPGPEEVLRATLRGEHPALPHLRYRILDDRPDGHWSVPRDGRCTVVYRVHSLVAEKVG